MYLGRRKIKARGYVSGYSQRDIPQPVNPDRLLSLVKKLRSGDTSVDDEIILGHLGLTIQLVGRYVNFFPQKAEDLLGVATVALVEAVKKFQYNAINDNITPYIVSTIHGQISTFLKRDCTVHLTKHTFKKIMDTHRNLPELYSIDAALQDPNTPISNLILKALKIQDTKSFNLEINEIINILNFTRFEALVYKRLCDGWTEADVARDLGYSRFRINQVKHEVARKLKPFFEEINYE